MNFKAVWFPKINIVCMHKIYTVSMFFSPLLPEHLWCNNSNIEIKKNIFFVLSERVTKKKILSPYEE